MSLVDDYEHPDPNLDYILENILQEPKENTAEYKELSDLFNSVLTTSCDCDLNCHSCLHGGNYTFSSSELVLSSNRDFIYECSNLCKCSSTCENRLVQHGPRRNLTLKEFPNKGLGLVTLCPIPRGGFICEYAGELLTRAETLRRHEFNDKHKLPNYIMCLNEISLEHGRKFVTFVDPSRKGNIGRWTNHSCEPNCKIVSVRIDCPLPKLAIFASRDVEAGEELCYDYGSETTTTSGGKLCYCESKNCKQFLPNTKYD